MAFAITSTYIGKDSKEFITPVMRAGRTLGVPGVTIKTNVNYKTRLTKLTASGLLKDATCAWDPAGTVNIDEVILEVKELEVNLELCKTDLIEDYIGSDMGCDDPLPGQFLNYLLSVIGGDIADKLEHDVWQGTDTAGSFAGFETRATASATVIKVGTPIAITAANAIAEIRRGIALAPTAILGKSDLLIYVGSKLHQNIREAINDKNSASACGEDCVKVDGISIFLAPGMSDGTYFIAQKSNMFFGTWSNSGRTHVKVKDMSDMMENNVRIGMCFFAGTKFGIDAEVVYYKGV